MEFLNILAQSGIPSKISSNISSDVMALIITNIAVIVSGIISGVAFMFTLKGTLQTLSSTVCTLSEEVKALREFRHEHANKVAILQVELEKSQKDISLLFEESRNSFSVIQEIKGKIQK